MYFVKQPEWNTSILIVMIYAFTFPKWRLISSFLQLIMPLLVIYRLHRCLIIRFVIFMNSLCKLQGSLAVDRIMKQKCGGGVGQSKKFWGYWSRSFMSGKLPWTQTSNRFSVALQVVDTENMSLSNFLAVLRDYPIYGMFKRSRCKARYDRR